MLKLEPLHPFTVRHIVWTARPHNMREMRLEFGSSWRERAVEWICLHNGPGWVVMDGTRPIAVFGMREFAKRKWSLYMIGTEAVEKCGRPLARLLKRTFREWATKVQPVSAEAKALKGNPKSPRWFAFLGARLARETATHEIYSFGGMPCVSETQAKKKSQSRRNATKPRAKSR